MLGSHNKAITNVLKFYDDLEQKHKHKHKLSSETPEEKRERIDNAKRKKQERKEARLKKERQKQELLQESLTQLKKNKSSVHHHFKELPESERNIEEIGECDTHIPISTSTVCQQSNETDDNDEIVWDEDSDIESEPDPEPKKIDTTTLVFYTMECGCIVEESNLSNYLERVSHPTEYRCGCRVYIDTPLKKSCEVNPFAQTRIKRKCGCHVYHTHKIHLQWSDDEEDYQDVLELRELPPTKDFRKLGKQHGFKMQKHVGSPLTTNIPKKKKQKIDPDTRRHNHLRDLAYFCITNSISKHMPPKWTTKTQDIIRHDNIDPTFDTKHSSQCEKKLEHLMMQACIASFSTPCTYSEKDGWTE